MLDVVLTNLIVVVVGYLFGSVNWAIIFSNKIYSSDVRTKGSGNAGATNMARNYPFWVSFLTFVLDFMKVVVAIIISWSLKTYIDLDGFNGIFIHLAALSAVIGHIFPLYFKFKGGKGVSSWWGFVLGFNFVLAIIALAIGLIILKLTKKVSLGSITVPTFIAVLALTPWFTYGPVTPFLGDYDFWVAPIFLFVIAMIILVKHIPNIKRMLNKTESTIDKFSETRKSREELESVK
ncbi:MAG: glycerol-3-phosphate 1-O-acyltransferase PlsY [Mycoplasma sp.]|nr:glycerol-3-phosphate 1-O-acyltransferase PlsY [Mycoplasma sp.]